MNGKITIIFAVLLLVIGLILFIVYYETIFFPEESIYDTQKPIISPIYPDPQSVKIDSVPEEILEGMKNKFVEAGVSRRYVDEHFFVEEAYYEKWDNPDTQLSGEEYMVVWRFQINEEIYLLTRSTFLGRTNVFVADIKNLHEFGELMPVAEVQEELIDCTRTLASPSKINLNSQTGQLYLFGTGPVDSRNKHRIGFVDFETGEVVCRYEQLTVAK